MLSYIAGHSVFNFKPYQHHGRQGTLVTEHIDIFIPYALQSFINRTVHDAHKNMMQNLKFILERTYNIDKDLKDEFEHAKEKQDFKISPTKATISEPSDEDEEDSLDIFHEG